MKQADNEKRQLSELPLLSSRIKLLLTSCSSAELASSSPDKNKSHPKDKPKTNYF
jgi:hypothetical protein